MASSTPAPTAGLSLKPQHFAAARDCNDAGLWFEVHAENYMVAGGPRLAWLQAIRARHPVALHGVGMSLAAAAPPDAAHLRRLADLVDRFDPVLVSEHLAWSTWRGAYLPDLLPVPRTHAVLRQVADNIDRVQQCLRRPIALENPSHYVHFDAHEFDEVGFLAELARRTGCGLLVDVNNVYVSARNLGLDAAASIDRFPAACIHEVHLAGHHADPRLGEALLIDAHDGPVAPAVWALFERLVARIGARPTLIERDGNVPGFEVLRAERARAHRLLCQVAGGPGRETGFAPAGELRTGRQVAGGLRDQRSSALRPVIDAQHALANWQDVVFATLSAGEPGPAAGVQPAELLTDGAAAFDAAAFDAAALIAQPGFAVYRNTVLCGCLDALQANYPVVTRLVGSDWLRAAAAVYARAQPPSVPMLADYGADFAAFLATFEPARQVPYLADIARIERAWTQAHLAADAAPLPAATVAALPPEDLATLVLLPHPSAHWCFSDEHPVFTIWQRNRGDADGQARGADADTGAGPGPGTDAGPPAWHGEGVLLVRPADVVQAIALDAAGCAFLSACAAGQPLAAAADAALHRQPDTDLAALMAALLAAGAFDAASVTNIKPRFANDEVRMPTSPPAFVTEQEVPCN